jgi:hypothetical protein
MPKVRIEYVGKKPYCSDNLARSKKVWRGRGDVQEVTEEQAEILLKHPDQWALAEDEAESQTVAPGATEAGSAPSPSEPDKAANAAEPNAASRNDAKKSGKKGGKPASKKGGANG